MGCLSLPRSVPVRQPSESFQVRDEIQDGRVSNSTCRRIRIAELAMIHAGDHLDMNVQGFPLGTNERFSPKNSVHCAQKLILSVHLENVSAGFAA